jgi:hypothetical protein
MNDKDHSRAQRFLVGDIPEEERDRLEEKLFADDAFFESLEALEEEMADDYVRGRLSPQDRTLFEQRLNLSSGLRRKVGLARALLARFPVSSSLRSPVAAQRGFSVSSLPWGWQGRARWILAMAASLLAILGMTGLLLQNDQFRRQLREMEAESSRLLRLERQILETLTEERVRNDETIAQLERERDRLARQVEQWARGRSRAGITIAFALSPGLTRDAENRRRLKVPAGAETVQIQLDLDREPAQARYRVMLLKTSGEEIWSQDAGPGRETRWGGVLRLMVPARILGPGDYELVLQTRATRDRLENLAYYYFSITP